MGLPWILARAEARALARRRRSPETVPQAFPGNAVTSVNAAGTALLSTYLAQPGLADHGGGA